MYIVQVFGSKVGDFSFNCDSAEELHEEIHGWEELGDGVKDIDKYTLQYVQDIKEERVELKGKHAIITKTQ